MKYEMIFREFKEKNENIETIDYRPCTEIHECPNIDNAIVIWLKSGTKIIYITE